MRRRSNWKPAICRWSRSPNKVADLILAAAGQQRIAGRRNENAPEDRGVFCRRHCEATLQSSSTPAPARWACPGSAAICGAGLAWSRSRLSPAAAACSLGRLRAQVRPFCWHRRPAAGLGGGRRLAFGSGYRLRLATRRRLWTGTAVRPGPGPALRRGCPGMAAAAEDRRCVSGSSSKLSPIR